MLLKKNVFPFGNKPGFTLFELVITIALLGMMLAVAIPYVAGRNAKNERDTFVSEINGLMAEVWLRGLEKGVVHKVNFDLDHRKIQVSEQTTQLDSDHKPIFKPIPFYFASNSYQWPETFDVQEFYIQKKDEIAAGGISRKTENIWFFVMPDGVCQEVIVNIFDQSSQKADSEGTPFSIVLNPFTSQCELYDSFQKPTA